MEVALVSVGGRKTATVKISWDAGTHNTPLGARKVLHIRSLDKSMAI